MKTNIHSILIIYLLFIAINPSKAVADVRTLGKVAKEIGRYSDEKPDEKVKYSINPIQIKAPLPIKPNLRLSPDPIRFSIQCDKDSITKGELFTITLTAELLPITSSMLFFFEEQKGFSLNLLLPKGFVQTGGDYFPYISDKLSPDSKKSISYTVKGYLDDVSQSATFTLLRGPKDATSNSLFERKGAVTLWQKYTSINSGKPASRQALVCTVKDQIDGLLFGKNQQGLFVIKVLTKSSASGIVYSLDNANFQTSNILTTSAIAGKVYFRYAADTACKSSLNFNLVPFISSNNSSTINKTAGTCGVEGFSVSPYPICKLNNNEFTISSVLNNWSGCSELSVQQIQNGVLSIIKTLTAGDLINNQGFIQLSFQGTVPETIIFRCDCSGNYQGWFVDLGNLSVTTPNDQVVTLSDGLPASRSGCQSVTFNVSGCANNSVYLLRKPNNTYTEINSTGVFTIAPGATGSFPYSIECLDACGQFTSNPLNVTANITHLNSPTIASSSSNTLSIGSTLSLTATGSCSNGTITWYRGNSLSIATGPVLSYTGIQTTTFFARCIQNQCSSPNSNSITITVLPFSVSPSSLNICPGSLFTLTSSGCGVGITWYNVTDDVVYTNTTSSLSTSLTITSLIKATCGSGQNAPNAFIQVTMSSPNIAFTSTTACTGSPAGQISVGISNPSNDFIDYRYRLESLDGQTVFTNWGINPNAFTYTFSNLVNGSYRIKVVKGSPTDCAASAIVTINCECGITVNGLPASNTVLIGNLLSLTAVRPQGMGSSTPLIWSGPTGSNFFVQSPTNTTVTSYSILGDIAYIAPNAIGTFKLRISNQAVPSCYNDYSLTVLPFACGCTDCDLPALVNTDNLSVFHAASTNQNFVVETVYLNTAGSHFNQTVSYFDGLGRPTQQVQIASGGSAYTQSGPGQDIVTIQEYDTVGRQVRKYLPITQSSNSGAFRTTIQASTINSYYNNTLERPGNAFTSINYEASPLNRVLSQTAPGSTTVVTMTQRTNSTADAVKLLTYVFSTSTVNVSSYSANALIVTEITNENNQKTTEYKDKQGRVICRDIAGLKTYYCYDDIGQLRCVIPPKAIGLLNNTSITPFDGANDLLFAYYYDNRGRLTRKKVPGSGITTLAYDNQDRLINTTDAKNISIITTYDVLDRVVSTSIAGGEMLTQNYYDNYSYAGSKAFDLSHAYSQPALATAQGLLTGSKVWGLGSANNQSWISIWCSPKTGQQ